MRKHISMMCMLLAIGFSLVGAGTLEAAPGDVVSEGSTVRVDYTLRVEGQVFDSTKDSGPLEFVAGGHSVIRGFENAVMGMKEGESRSFSVRPEDGYGLEDPSGIKEMPKKVFPQEIPLEAGKTIYIRRGDGQQHPIRIVAVKEETVLINFNPPLAGKTLEFEVKVVEIK